MEIRQNTNAQNFEGKFIMLGKYSKKTQRSITKVGTFIGELIKNKKFDLYVKQDYSTCEIVFSTGKNGIESRLPVTSASYRYIDAAEEFIDLYEKDLYNQKQQKWEILQKQRNMQEKKEILLTIMFFPLYIVRDVLHSMNTKWSEKFEKSVMDKVL